MDPDGPAFVDIDTSRTLTHLASQPELRTALDALGVVGSGQQHPWTWESLGACCSSIVVVSSTASR